MQYYKSNYIPTAISHLQYTARYLQLMCMLISTHQQLHVSASPANHQMSALLSGHSDAYNDNFILCMHIYKPTCERYNSIHQGTLF